jgi:hypothetical protein
MDTLKHWGSHWELIMGKNKCFWVDIQVRKWCDLCLMPNSQDISQSASHENMNYMKITVLTMHKVDTWRKLHFWVPSEHSKRHLSVCWTAGQIHVCNYALCFAREYMVKNKRQSSRNFLVTRLSTVQQIFYRNLEMVSKGRKFNYVTTIQQYCRMQLLIFTQCTLSTVAQTLGLLN